MESRFHHDFSRVRIHDDAAAERAASAYAARAFTVGPHIAFAGHQYAPGTRAGMGLLAHELAHVVQGSHDHSPVVRRSPDLKDHGTNDLVDERIAPDIDKAIAQSKTIGRFVAADKLTKETGNVEVDDPVVFQKRYEKSGNTENVDQVPGYVDRTAKKQVRLRRQGMNEKKQLVVGATVEVAMHEAIHINSSTVLQGNFGHQYNEGITQHFAETVLQENGLAHGKAYPDQLKLADGLIAALGTTGEDQVGVAYFKGDRTLYAGVLKALGNDFSAWHDAAAKDPPDWRTATRLLNGAMARARRQAPTATPGTGSGSSAGSGSAGGSGSAAHKTD
jgi:hypothetical protein